MRAWIHGMFKRLCVGPVKVTLFSSVCSSSSIPETIETHIRVFCQPNCNINAAFSYKAVTMRTRIADDSKLGTVANNDIRNAQRTKLIIRG